jgi:release factor glutamine methyltransferase
VTSHKIVKDIKSLFGNSKIHNLDNEIRWFVEEKIFPKKSHLSLNVLPQEAEALINDFVTRRKQGEPLAYILGNQDFMGLRFAVSPAVLIPRRETEEMVECIENEYSGVNEEILFADLGSGSGCIGISLAKRNNKFRGDLIEISGEAFEVLKQNRATLDLQNKTEAHCASVEEFFATTKKMYRVIVANPPYIDELDPRVDPDTRKYEPNLALFAKKNGMELILNWQECAFDHLMSTGAMFIEIGHEQGPALKEHFLTKQLDFKIYQDLQGRDRWIRLTR